MTDHGDTSPEGPYEAHRALIDLVIQGTCRHHRLEADAASDFRSFAWERLLSADPLRSFQQRCSLRTFLTVVIGNYYRDFRNHRWGKWRPSTEARRLGPVAVRLETLMVRDGYAFDEAVEIIRINEQTPVSRQELEAIQLQLPPRVRAQLVNEVALEGVAMPGVDLDRAVEREGRRALSQLVRVALAAALSELEPQDRIILKLLFEEGFTVAKVAAAVHLPQKLLYRRRDQVLKRLRRHLEAAGISAAAIESLLQGTDDPEDDEESDHDGASSHPPERPSPSGGRT